MWKVVRHEAGVHAVELMKSIEARMEEKSATGDAIREAEKVSYL